MALIYTEIYSNDFQGPDQDPLVGWTMRGPGRPPEDTLVRVNNLGSSSTRRLGDGQGTFDSVMPDDQYQEVILHSLATQQGGTFMYLRCGQGALGDFTPGYVFEFFGGLNNPAITEYSVYQFNAAHDFVYFWKDFQTGVLNLRVGSVIRCGVKGDYATGKLYIEVDGVRIFTGNLSDSPAFLASGKVGWQIYLNDHPNPPTVDMFSVSRWAAGSLTEDGSPDGPSVASRVYGTRG